MRCFDSVLLIMSSLVILFVVIAVINPVLSNALPRNVDANVLFSFVNQLHGDDHNSAVDTEDSDSLDTDAEEKVNRFDTAKLEEIINVISKLTVDKPKNKENNNFKNKKNEKVRYTIDRSDVSEFRKPDIENTESMVIQQLLSKDFNQITNPRALRVKHNKFPPLPNTVKPFKLDDNSKKNDLSGLGKYSKIYIMLNPSAVSKSKNKYSLNDLLAKILSKSSSLQNEQQPRNKKSRFAVKGVLRRARRESNEMYAPKDSMEDDYKQKRARNAAGGGGGGGGAGGRTAIPYIHHRGDIYERDN